MSRRWRQRPSAVPVGLMKDHHTTRSQVSGKFSNHRRRVGGKHQDIPTNYGVKGLLKRYLNDVAFNERHIRQRLGLSPRLCCRHCDRRPVYSDDFATLTHQFGCKRGNMADTTADIEHSHTGGKPCFPEKVPGDRIDKSCLRIQTLKLTTRMTKPISWSWNWNGVVAEIIH